MLERLALISLGRAAGFSLEEIARMFASDGRPRIDRQVLAAKAEELDRTIRKLSAMRDGLRHRSLSCAEPHGMPHLPPPPGGRGLWSDRGANEEAPRPP